MNDTGNNGTGNNVPNINLKEVDSHSAICFNANCPSHGNCLRFVAGTQSSATLLCHLCVVPQAVKGERCELYQSTTPVRMAYGFSRSYDDVLKRDFTSIRKELTDYLSNKRGYYKYLHGEWPLKPSQQRHIESVFRRYGYEGKVVYDRMEDVLELEIVPY